MYIISGEHQYLDDAVVLADTAVAKLEYHGLFRGHPAKPYYEAMDGVGNLLYALLQLDQVLKDPKAVVDQRAIIVTNSEHKIVMDLDNW